MKQFLLIAVALVMIFTLTACGEKEPASNANKPTTTAAQQTEKPADTMQSDVPDTDASSEAAEENIPDDSKPSAANSDQWLNTKTGRFYSGFSDGKIYMEYEMDYYGTLMNVKTATLDGKTYSESTIDGQSMGASIMDGEYMYTIYHADKTVYKMDMPKTAMETVKTMISEEDVNLSALKTGTREIDGKTYDTEDFGIDGTASIMCFDGDRLAYMIAGSGEEEMILKIVRADNNVDEALFKIPSDYEIVSY